MSLIWNFIGLAILGIILWVLGGRHAIALTRALYHWFRRLSKPKDERVALRQIWRDHRATIIFLGLVLAFWGYGFARDFYNRVFIDQPVAYKDLSQRFEMHRSGTYLGSKDHVTFCLWGPKTDEQDFDDWEVVAEMKIADSDLLSCLPKLARAASLHGYNRVVLFPNKNNALVVDSDSEDILNQEAAHEVAEPPSGE